MTRTRQAPWDYQRNTGIAPFNATCPNCSSRCYDGLLPDGSKFYSCPTCGIVTQADIARHKLASLVTGTEER